MATKKSDLKQGARKSISVAKEKAKKELTELIKNKKTILIASIKNIPSSQYQEIVKKLRGKAIVKVPKKSILFRALNGSGNEAVKELKNHIKESIAILFSDMDAFELAEELASKKSFVKAKAGQESLKDIEVQEGPTELVPGPAITELGALGIQIKIEKGKIHIKESKIIVRKGEKISAVAADIMNKFNIKPFSIGFIPLAAFDTKEEKLYLDIKIDKEETLNKLRTAFSKALGFAVEIEYFSRDTIGFLIRKAAAHEKVFKKFAAKDKKDINNTKNIEVNSEGSSGMGGGLNQTQTLKENSEEKK
jgi:large subunit ribosomal protein L10